jgi:cyclophilin family peptidyl-prolyl cis-trans isomerase
VTAVIRTAKGEIEVVLYPDEAPLNVASLAFLAGRGFYRGLTFHRVVPDFVVQGGDPRGDGNGGPGYDVRCEYGRRRFARGSLGIALAGRDTGGSQIFITHLPTPHLDGRFTVLGDVTRGQDVVDALVVGDLIADVQVKVE